MKRFKYFIILPLLFALGCNKMLDVKTPPNVLYPTAVFTDSANVKSAVLGLYGGMEGTNSYNFLLTVLNSLYADETTSLNYPTYLTNTVSPADTYLDNMWSDNYALINRANSLMEGVQSSTALAATTKQQAIGEALFLRAYFYFNLVNIYGNIPLIITTNTSANATAPQVASSAIYTQMIADLKQAIAYLPANYTVSGNLRTRASKFAAIALLAKVYLYNQDWADADTQASLLISNSLFSLPALNTVFLSSSTEAIFQLDNTTTGYAAIAGSFVPTAGVVPSYQLQTALLNAFETGDQRKTNWTATSAGYYYPAKYKITTTGGKEFLTIFRLAEMYLIRAEARTHEANISGAQSDLNAVRSRAGLGNTTAADAATLQLAIEQERRVELFCEWGNRFFDLKRTGRADAVLGTEKTAWKSTDINYPIPTIEISSNDNLKQNAGY